MTISETRQGRENFALTKTKLFLTIMRARSICYNSPMTTGDCIISLGLLAYVCVSSYFFIKNDLHEASVPKQILAELGIALGSAIVFILLSYLTEALGY